MSAPRLYVPPPAPTPQPYGLLSVVEARFDNPDPHWRNGVTYQALCGSAATTYDPCTAVTGIGGAPTPAGKAATAHLDLRGATAFTVYAEIDCSAVGFYEQAQSRAGEALARTESYQVERALWTGLAAGQPVVYPHLAANAALLDSQSVALQSVATIVVTGVADAAKGLGLLEQSLADCYDGVGVIHVPQQLVAAMAGKGLLVRDGGRLRTWNGNLVAAGAGYPGTSPAGAAPPTGQAWIYATGAVFAYRSAPYVNPTPSSMDRATNTVKVIAERTYLLGWDCCHFAVLIDLEGEESVTVTGPVTVTGTVAVTGPVDVTGTLTPAATSTVSIPLTGSPPASQVVSATPTEYRGFTLRETAGATAVVVLWDNAAAAAGTVLEEISLAANESARELYPDGGARAAAGIYCQVVSGAVAGSVRTG